MKYSEAEKDKALQDFRFYHFELLAALNGIKRPVAGDQEPAFPKHQVKLLYTTPQPSKTQTALRGKHEIRQSKITPALQVSKHHQSVYCPCHICTTERLMRQRR